MIYITRPVIETHKITPKTGERTLDSNLKDRKNTQQIKKYEEDKPNLNQDNLEKAVKDMNKMLFREDSRFEFKIHKGTGRMMVKLIDNETDEIIKEIPSEKILDVVASIWDLVGILVDERG